MSSSEGLPQAHPQGEIKTISPGTLDRPLEGPVLVDTAGGRYRVEWDEECADAPLVFTSNNAPTVTDVLGTVLLSVLAGHHRYAHMTALRFDNVTPALFGMSKVVSEDSARRALEKLGQIKARSWLQKRSSSPDGAPNGGSSCLRRREPKPKSWEGAKTAMPLLALAEQWDLESGGY